MLFYLTFSFTSAFISSVINCKGLLDSIMSITHKYPRLVMSGSISYWLYQKNTSKHLSVLNCAIRHIIFLMNYEYVRGSYPSSDSYVASLRYTVVPSDSGKVS